MTYKEAWEAIHFRHCEETCDYAYMDNCQEGKCEYYMALQALNRQYYAECGSVWTKPLADRKTENSSEIPNNYEDEPKYEMGMGTLKCDNCSEYGSFKCTKCDGEMYFKRLEPKDEPTISKMEQVEDEPQTNADQHIQSVESVESVGSNLEPFRVDEPQTERSE